MFTIKNKKNPYWVNRNKWKYFWTEGSLWFKIKKKKKIFLLINKNYKINSYFFYQNNPINFFRSDCSLIKHPNYLQLLIKNNNIKNSPFSVLDKIIFDLQTPKLLPFYLQLYYLFNQKSFFFNFCKLTFNFRYKKSLISQSATLYTLPSILVNKKKINSFWLLKKQFFFTNHKLIRLFYKKNKYGFFWFNSNYYKNFERMYVTKNSLNFDKFFIFKIKKPQKLQKQFLINTDFKFSFSSVESTKTFLSIKTRYCSFKINNFSSRLLTYFDFYKNQNKLIKLSKFSIDTTLNNSKHFLFYQKSFFLHNINFFFKKISPLLSNIEFFFTSSFTFLIFKIFTLENFLFFKNKKFSTFTNFLNFYFNNFFFYSKTNPSSFFTNITTHDSCFNFNFKKYLIRTFSNKKFSIEANLLHHENVIRFLEFCSGKKIYSLFNPFMSNLLTFEEKTRCLLWSQKIKSFRKVLGPRLFLNESLQIIYLCLKNKDVYVLSSWMLQMFYKISFWKYKLFFRYMQYILRYFFWGIFSTLKLNGLKFQMKGKISVAGNARTRTVLNKIGTAGHSSFKNKILYDLKLIKTFTGVIGFKTWMFF